MPVLLARRVLIAVALCASGAALFVSPAFVTPARAQTSQPANATASAPTSEPAAPVVPVDASTPRGALKSLLEATKAGDSEKIKHLISTTNPTESKMVSAMAGMSTAERHFRTALEGFFGDKAKDLTAEVDSNAVKTMAHIDGMQESVNGNTATLAHAAPNGGDLTLNKVGSDWQIPMNELSQGVDNDAVNQRLEDLAMISTMMNESADEVSKGMYKTPQAATDAIQNKMMVAMMKKAAAATQPTTAPTDAPALTPAPAKGSGL